MTEKAVNLMKGAEPALHIAGVGFLFWTAFLLALDPDMIFGAADGWLAAVSHDAPRIVAASVLGSCMAAVQYVLVARFPVAGERRLGRLAIHASACLGLSLAALVVAKAGAPLILAPDSPRLVRSLGEEIAANWLLLTFALGVFATLLHLQRKPVASAPAKMPSPVRARDERISVHGRNGILLIAIDVIDWVRAIMRRCMSGQKRIWCARR